MSKLYCITCKPFGASAKNKGMVEDSRITSATTLANAPTKIWATDIDDAYRQACEYFWPEDARPLSGKSYMHPVYMPRVGDWVKIAGGYVTGCDASGNETRTYYGMVTAVLDELHVCVQLSGSSRAIDCHVCELWRARKPQA